jgi:hypothetical protein
MEEKLKNFINCFEGKGEKQFALSEFKTSRGNISFRKLLVEHNHEIWKKCKCGNEEDLRMTWHCSKCGAELFKIEKK